MGLLALAFAVVACMPDAAPPAVTRAAPTPLVVLIMPDTPTTEPSATPTVAPTATRTNTPAPSPTATRTPTATPRPATPTAAAANLPPKVQLTVTHEYQKWNNCGPVSLGIVTTFLGVPRTQADIADRVKGYEKDKNVRPDEMQAYLAGQGLSAIVRVNGTREQLMRLLAAGLPVIVHQWLAKSDGELVGHYRVVSGYDTAAGTFTSSDPFTPPRKTYSFADFETWWKPWNHRYIVAYKPPQEAAVRAALGEDFDAQANARRALAAAMAAVQAAPLDAAQWFNLGDDRLLNGDASGAVEAYDRANALGMPGNFAWYNFGPFDALYRTGAFQRIIDSTTPQMKNLELIEEVHYWRGRAFLALGQKDRARESLAAAVQLNANYKDAQDLLAQAR